jgi:cysteinyl-tRNA synthetase
MVKIKEYSTGNKVEINKDKITSYVCGPTVYNDVHVGNIRPILVMDIFAKALKASGKELDLVHNITDIDDKIINKANELGISENEVSEKYTKLYLDLLDQLNIDSIKYMPKVTENIEDIINVIQSLIDNGFAYEVNGSVYFRVDRVEDYGEQHKVSTDELQSEQEAIDNKENAQDFAL